MNIFKRWFSRNSAHTSESSPKTVCQSLEDLRATFTNTELQEAAEELRKDMQLVGDDLRAAIKQVSEKFNAAKIK